MSSFCAKVKDKLDDLWRAIKRYNDKNKWGDWAKVTALSLESVENTMKISEERALETISGPLLRDLEWALANIKTSGYNEEGIKLQLEALLLFIRPKSEAEVRESTAAEGARVDAVRARVDAVEKAKRKKRLEELLQELRELLT
jgi:hypothetical protein